MVTFQQERVVLAFPKSHLSISVLQWLSHLQPLSTGRFGLSQWHSLLWLGDISNAVRFSRNTKKFQCY